MPTTQWAGLAFCRVDDARCRVRSAEHGGIGRPRGHRVAVPEGRGPSRMADRRAVEGRVGRRRRAAGRGHRLGPDLVRPRFRDRRDADAMRRDQDEGLRAGRRRVVLDRNAPGPLRRLLAGEVQPY